MKSGSVESITGFGRRPAFAVERVIGASHRRTDKPCQDEAGVVAVADTVAIAVADGHGTSRHADVGARLAVQVALGAVVRFAEDLGERASNPHEVRGYAEHPLRVQLVREWAERVRAKAGDDETPLIEYGSTILVALATPDFLLVGQLGDGDVLLVAEDGTVDVPLPADPAAFADETPSLCLPEAWHSFRMRVLPAPSEEALLLLSTDGYGKSYTTDAGFRQIGPDYLDLVRKKGVSGLAPCLKGFLEQVTTRGSGDDIALALLHWPPPASRAAPESPGVLTDGTPSITGVVKSGPPPNEGDGDTFSYEAETPERQACEGDLVSPLDTTTIGVRRIRADRAGALTHRRARGSAARWLAGSRGGFESRAEELA